MAESDRKQVRVRMAVSLDEWNRWVALSVKVGVPVERLVILGSSMALPEMERRIAALVSPMAAAQLIAEPNAPAPAGEPRAIAAVAAVKPQSLNINLGAAGGKKKAGRR